jgi:hypothetical protein
MFMQTGFLVLVCGVHAQSLSTHYRFILYSLALVDVVDLPRGAHSHCFRQYILIIQCVKKQLRWLDAGFIPWRHKFKSGWFNVRFMVKDAIWKQDFSASLLVFFG